MTTFNDPPWYKDALCAQVDGDLFFPEQGESPRAALSVCKVCPTRQACGVWGGKTEQERRHLLRGTTPPKGPRLTVCTVGECGRPNHARGYCKWHYDRIVRPRYVAL